MCVCECFLIYVWAKQFSHMNRKWRTQTKPKLYKLINSAAAGCFLPLPFELTEFRLNFCLGIFAELFFLVQRRPPCHLTQQSENCCRNFCVLHKYFSNIFRGIAAFFFIFVLLFQVEASRFYASIVACHMQLAISNISPFLSLFPGMAQLQTQTHLKALGKFGSGFVAVCDLQTDWKLIKLLIVEPVGFGDY